MGGSPLSTPETFWSRVNKDGDCWLWQGTTDHKGYGRLRYRGKFAKAHRLGYELEVGPIPDGMFVLHSCDNPRCVNPAHLRVGTHEENMQDRADRHRLHGSSDLTCPNGHLWTPESEGRQGSGARKCRFCVSQQEKARRWKKRVADLEADKMALQARINELVNALADVVARAIPYGDDEDGFIMHYLSGTGAIHAAIPLLDRYGITVRPGAFDSRKAGQ